jgi:hypothetical protein
MVEVITRFSVFVQVGIVFLMLVDISEVIILKVVVLVFCILVYQMLIMHLILPKSGCWSCHVLSKTHTNASISPTEIRICLLLMLIVVHSYFL